jgi:diacylglycerol kinase family enzyme
MTVSIDGRVVASGPLTGIVAANGPFTGGGMNLAPTAQLDDGTLNILVMNDLTLARRLQSFPKIYSGSHLTSKCFGYHEGKRVSIRSEERVFVEADGELLGTAPCDIEIVSSALEVVSVPVKGENGHATVS